MSVETKVWRANGMMPSDVLLEQGPFFAIQDAPVGEVNVIALTWDDATRQRIVRAVNSHDELVEAAERLLQNLDDSDDCDQDGNERDVLHALREAIAKAKGTA